MLEKLKSLSMGVKAGIASGVVLLAAAGVGLGIPQPWKNQEETLPPDPPPVQQEVPDEPAKKPEEGLSVRAGNDVVPCALYEGNGWSIYVPEGWTAQGQGANGARFSSGDGRGVPAGRRVSGRLREPLRHGEGKDAGVP